MKPRQVKRIYVERPVPPRKPIMVPHWISVIVLTAVAIWSVLYLMKVL